MSPHLLKICLVLVVTLPLTAWAQNQPPNLSQAVPLTIDIPQERLDDIRDRVLTYEWQDMPASGGWTYGTNLPYMQELVDYWVSDYDWREQERAFNRFDHYKAQVGNGQLHFVLERGSGSDPQPLLLLHGWPYSFVSLLPLVESLAHPERFGGDAEDGFDVVVPSLPGYGFSDSPANPVGPHEMAETMNRLMTDVLGYERYLVQGGDWGAQIAAWMGFDYAPNVAGLHLNLIAVRHDGSPLGSGLVGPGPSTEAERAFAEAEQASFARDGAYFQLQGTRPQTLSYGMMDSPVGTAAWMVEKFYNWSDQQQRDFDAIFTKDQLLNEVMTYLVTDTFDTSTWIYAGYFAEEPKNLPPGERITVPVAFAAFPDPFAVPPPRSYVERSHNLVQYTDMPSGGHFPFLEEPQLLLEDIRTFARLMR